MIALVCLISWLFAREMRLVREQPVSSWTEDQNADCAVVLTGGPQRVREGFDLLIRKSVQKLIISGVNPSADVRDIFPLLLFHGEVRENDIILEKHSLTTYGNAQQSLALVEALRCRDIILVTSRLHMYRALSTFREEFPSTIPIYPRSVVAGQFESDWLEVAWETFKSMFYSLWAY